MNANRKGCANRMATEGRKNKEKQKLRGSVRIYERLREDILWLKIAPGTPIDEVELAKRFEVSRTPIREALLLLQGDWLVQFLPNRTSIVAPLSLNNTQQYFDSHLMLARLTARSAAMSKTAKEEDLRRQTNAFRKSIINRDHLAALRASLALSRDLTALTGNIFLERYFGHSLDSGIRTRIMYFFPNATDEDLERAADLADATIDAIVAGDADASDAAMNAMIMHEVEIIVQSLQPAYGKTMEIKPWRAAE